MFQSDKNAFVFDAEAFFVIKVRKGIKSESFVHDSQIEIKLIRGRFFVLEKQGVVGVQEKQCKPFFLADKALVSFSGKPVERIEGSFECNFYRIEKIGDMLGNFSIQFEIQNFLGFKVAVEEREGDFSRLISRFDRLVKKNPVGKNLDDGDMKLHAVFTDPHRNRKNVAGWSCTASAARNGFIIDGVREDMQQYEHVRLSNVGQVFQGDLVA